MRVLKTGALFTAFLLSATGTCLANPATIDQSQPMPTPDYPFAAQAQGETGDVLLDVKVDSNGRAQRIRLDHSSGFSDLDTAAVQTAATFHYKPADGSDSWNKIMIRYEIPTTKAQ